MMPSLEQQRLAFAITAVREVKQDLETDKGSFKEYVQRTRSLPAQIMQSGLHMALLFCVSKKNDPQYQTLYQQLNRWFCQEGPFRLKGAAEGRDLLEVLAEGDMEQYMQATRESLAVLVHLKRLASAELEEADDA